MYVAVSCERWISVQSSSGLTCGPIGRSHRRYMLRAISARKETVSIASLETKTSKGKLVCGIRTECAPELGELATDGFAEGGSVCGLCLVGGEVVDVDIEPDDTRCPEISMSIEHF